VPGENKEVIITKKIFKLGLLLDYEVREILRKAIVISILIAILIGIGIFSITGNATGAICVSVATGLFAFYHIYLLAALAAK
jgi:hypothetical protein